MDVQLRRARPGRGQPAQPGVELLVGGLARLWPWDQVGAADLPEVLGQPARGQLVADKRPSLGGQRQEIVPGPAGCRRQAGSRARVRIQGVPKAGLSDSPRFAAARPSLALAASWTARSSIESMAPWWTAERHCHA